MACDHDKSKDELIAELERLRSRLKGLEDDAAKLRRTVAALRRGEERHHLAITAVNDGVWDWNLADNTVYCGPTFLSMLGYEPDELRGGFELWESHVHPEDLPRVKADLNDYLHGRKPDYQIEFRMISKSGDPVWVLSRGRIFARDIHGKPVRMLGTYSDITSRKKVEDQLRHAAAGVLEKLGALLSPEGDIGALSLEEILDAHDLQALMDDFFRLTGIGIAILDIEGKVLVSQGWQDICVKFHRVHPETSANCTESDTRLSSSVTPGEFKLYRCRNRMWDIVTPIMAGDTHIGNIFLGQFFFDDEEIDYELFRAQARRHGFDEEEYLAALDRAPRWGRDTVFAVMSFYAKLAEMLSRLSHAKIKLARSLAERDRLLESLRKSESNHRLLADNVSDMLWVYNLDADSWEYMSPSVERLLGFTVEEAIAKAPDSPIAPQFRPVVRDIMARGKEAFLKGMGDDSSQPHELQMTRKDGSVIWTETVTRHTRNDDDELLLIGITRDITQRRQAQEALEVSERNLRSLLDATFQSVALVQCDGEIVLAANEIFAERLGLSASEVIGRRMPCLLSPEVAARRRQFVETVICTRNPVVVEDERDGRYMRSHLYPVLDAEGKVDRIAVYAEDITERRRAEDALKESEAKFRRMVETSREGVWAMNGDYETTFVNDKMAEMLGYNPEEMLGRTVDSFMFPEDLAGHHGRMERRRMGETQVYEHRFQRKDGGELVTIVSATALMDEKGEFQGSFAMFTDITKLRSAQRELLQEKDKFKNILDSMNFSVYIVNRHHDIEYLNPLSEAEYGPPAGRKCHEYFHDLSEPCPWCMNADVFAGRSVQWEWTSSKTGKSYVLFDCPVHNADGTVSKLAIFHDVTDRKRAVEKQLEMEAQLRQAQKMEAVGTLAGGVAHDFNNILQLVLGYSQLLLADRTADDFDFDELSLIQGAATRGADLVRRLLTLGRKAASLPRSVDLNEQIMSMERLLTRTITPMIKIRLDLDPDLPKIMADPTQTDQVLMNLALNARDAMRDGGTLTVRTKPAAMDQADCAAHPDAAPGSYVMLSVSDTGEGITEETRERIFEPFFTTKEEGKGAGLGLAMVYGIVKQHGGHIRVFSQVGAGADFQVYLPVHLGETVQETKPLTHIAGRGSETILLVEDEPAVRLLGVKVLEQSGYKVIPAENGRSALDVYERMGDAISLVILDLLMPEMSGRQCLEGLRKINPEVKVLIASGFSGAGFAPNDFDPPVKGFLSKPFELVNLRVMIREALDKEG